MAACTARRRMDTEDLLSRQSSGFGFGGRPRSAESQLSIFDAGDGFERPNAPILRYLDALEVSTLSMHGRHQFQCHQYTMERALTPSYCWSSAGRRRHVGLSETRLAPRETVQTSTVWHQGGPGCHIDACIPRKLRRALWSGRAEEIGMIVDLGCFRDKSGKNLCRV